MNQQHTSPARIGFIGAGGHSTESLYPNIPFIPEFDLVAVCDVEEEKARHAAGSYGAEHVFTAIQEMFEQVELDGVCVCGPPQMHYEVGLEVLQQGLPLFLEKPPGRALWQAQELADAARGNRTWGMVAFMKRFAPANLLVKELISKPEFGELSSVTTMHGCGPYDELLPMLLRNGVHMIDTSRFFGGEIEQLHAYGLDQAGPKAVMVSLRFASGAVGLINQNSGHAWSNSLEQAYLTGQEVGVLIRDAGQVEVTWPRGHFAEGEGLRLYAASNCYEATHNASGWWPSGHYTRGYWGEMSHFARACQGVVEPAPTLDDSVETMRVVQAIMLSLETSQPVCLRDVT